MQVANVTNTPRTSTATHEEKITTAQKRNPCRAHRRRSRFEDLQARSEAWASSPEFATPAAPLLTCFLTASAYAAVSTPCTIACRRSRFEDPQARSEAWASSALGRGALPARGGETCPEEVDAVRRRGAPAATR
jgi:hypothetical protein